MKYEVIYNVEIGELANTSRGLRLSSVDKNLDTDSQHQNPRGRLKIKEAEKIKNDKSILRCKILNFSNLNALNKGESLDRLPIYAVNADRKNKKENIFVKKNDIVINTFLLENKSNVLQIQNEVNLNYVYSELVFVIRVNEEIIDPNYVYTILSSDYFQQHLLDVAIKGKAIKYRMSLEILKNIKIPILSEESKKKFYAEYNKKKKLEQELKKANEQFNNDIESIAKLTK